jgi:hypothetical protein
VRINGTKLLSASPDTERLIRNPDLLKSFAGINAALQGLHFFPQRGGGGSPTLLKTEGVCEKKSCSGTGEVVTAEEECPPVEEEEGRPTYKSKGAPVSDAIFVADLKTLIMSISSYGLGDWWVTESVFSSSLPDWLLTINLDLPCIVLSYANLPGWVGVPGWMFMTADGSFDPPTASMHREAFGKRHCICTEMREECYRKDRVVDKAWPGSAAGMYNTEDMMPPESNCSDPDPKQSGSGSGCDPLIVACSYQEGPMKVTTFPNGTSSKVKTKLYTPSRADDSDGSGCSQAGGRLQCALWNGHAYYPNPYIGGLSMTTCSSKVTSASPTWGMYTGVYLGLLSLAVVVAASVGLLRLP